ncbi:MAG: hypothetical protein LCH26_04810 [Proteobacteria bacterium]|nr:hypothetical protein [Pseudomonadota bacterium]
MLRYVFLCVLCLFSKESCGATFEEAIKQDHFFVEPSAENLKEMHEATTLVIGCIDFRLRDELKRFLKDSLSLLDDYDEVTLPGASLAFVEKKYPHWTQTIEEVTQLVQGLHKVKRVIFVDHMGCGAYTLLRGKDRVKTPELERAEHVRVLKEAEQKMKGLFPNLEVYGFILGLDGNVEQIK